MESDRLFELAGADDGDRLVAELRALGNATPSTVRNTEDVSLLLFCAYRGLRDLGARLAREFPEISFHESVALGDLEQVARRLERSTDALNTLSPDGWTPLHLAALLGRNAIAHMLLDFGADPSLFSRAFERNLPLHAAAACPLTEADVVARIATVTPDVDARQSKGHTALMLAAAGGRLEAVQALIQEGAATGARNTRGKTARAMAQERDHAEIAETLRAAEAEAKGVARPAPK